MIHNLPSLMGSNDIKTTYERKGKIIWVRAVKSPFKEGLIGRIKDAWAVFTGKAYAITWPKAGDVEKGWYGDAE